MCEDQVRVALCELLRGEAELGLVHPIRVRVRVRVSVSVSVSVRFRVSSAWLLVGTLVIMTSAVRSRSRNVSRPDLRPSWGWAVRLCG